MNKRDRAVVDWVKKNNPDIADKIASIVEESLETAPTVYRMLCIAFEAGRDFQKGNPDAPDGPSAYL